MKDLSPGTLVAILHEMFGFFLWILLGVAALMLVFGVVFLFQRRRFRQNRLQVVLIAATAIGIGAVLIAPMLTNASFANIHGLLDWASLGAIALIGFASVLWMAYIGLSRPDRRPLRTEP